MAEQSNSAADTGVSWGAKVLAGLVAGILAAVLMLGFMMAYSSASGAGATTLLKALGALIYGVEALVAGSNAIAAGAGIQFGFSILLGILFGLGTSRRTSMILELLVGIIVGIAVWVAMELYVLPFIDPTMAARVELMPIAYFVAHVLFGIGLGLTSLFVRAFGRSGHHTLIEGRAQSLLTQRHDRGLTRGTSEL